jgi:hypothetical protein
MPWAVVGAIYWRLKRSSRPSSSRCAVRNTVSLFGAYPRSSALPRIDRHQEGLDQPIEEGFIMTRTLTIGAAILAAGLLLRATPPTGAQAAEQAPAEALPAIGVADVAWPLPQEPLDSTPITPVESAGAPAGDAP